MVLVVCRCFLLFFHCFYRSFGGQELETTVKTKKNHEFWILRDSLNMVVFLVFRGFTMVLVFFVVVGGFFVSFTIGLVVSTSKPL